MLWKRYALTEQCERVKMMFEVGDQIEIIDENRLSIPSSLYKHYHTGTVAIVADKFLDLIAIQSDPYVSSILVFPNEFMGIRKVGE